MSKPDVIEVSNVFMSSILINKLKVPIDCIKIFIQYLLRQKDLHKYYIISIVEDIVTNRDTIHNNKLVDKLLISSDNFSVKNHKSKLLFTYYQGNLCIVTTRLSGHVNELLYYKNNENVKKYTNIKKLILDINDIPKIYNISYKMDYILKNFINTKEHSCLQD